MFPIAILQNFLSQILDRTFENFFDIFRSQGSEILNLFTPGILFADQREFRTSYYIT